MLRAYLDLGEKQDSTDAIICVGSVIFKPTAYKQFVRPWNRMLKAWDAPFFHSTDFYNGSEAFKRDTDARQQLHDEYSKLIPGMIANHVERISLVAFKPQEFIQIAPPDWIEKFGHSVYSHAVQLCLIANGWWRYEKHKLKKFAYFIESGGPDKGEIAKTVAQMRVEDETANVIGIQSFTSADKGTVRGLEAADFAAWHWNKYYMDKIRAGKETEPRKDFEAFANIAGDRIYSIFATGATLKYFFSLVPPPTHPSA